MRTLVKMLPMVAACLAMQMDAHTPDETNEVVRALLQVVSSPDDDNLGDSSSRFRIFHRTERRPFFDMEIDGWTRIEKEAAFQSYLRDLGTMDFGHQPNSLFIYAEDAVQHCYDISYTNAVPSLMGLITNRTCSVNLRCTAIRTFVKLCTVDDVATQFVENMITNTVKYGFRERGLICDHYAKKIYDMHTQDGRANSAKDRAVKMLYRYRLFDLVGTGLLDNLFTAYFSGYDVSSNRLEVATYILNHPKCDRYDRRDFASITNQLLSTGRTLEWLNIETGGNEQ